MITAEQLAGVWSGCAFPTQETTVVFCRGGQGLLFFFVGSSGGTPVVDEFFWSVEGEDRLKVRWLSRHEYDLEPATGTALRVINGGEETVFVEVDDSRPPAIRVSLGLHDDAYDDTWLNYQGPAGAFTEERERLRTLAENFDLFGPDRQLWAVGGGQWRATMPGRGAAPLGLDRTRLVLSFLLFGAMGQMLLWMNPVLAWTTHRQWILLPLLLLPLFAAFRENYFPAAGWRRTCLVLQMLLSAVYLLMAVAGLAWALLPITPPAGRGINPLAFALTALGAVPCVYLLAVNPSKMRSKGNGEPTLAEMFQDWRDWRIHGMNAWLFLGIMTGIVSEMCFLLGHGPHWLTQWPRILLHCVPASIVVFDDGSRAAVAAQKFGALWYFAVLTLAITAFSHGRHPTGMADTPPAGPAFCAAWSSAHCHASTPCL